MAKQHTINHFAEKSQLSTNSQSSVFRINPNRTPKETANSSIWFHKLSICRNVHTLKSEHISYLPNSGHLWCSLRRIWKTIWQWHNNICINSKPVSYIDEAEHRRFYRYKNRISAPGGLKKPACTVEFVVAYLSKHSIGIWELFF